jgi:hypothetical protein
MSYSAQPVVGSSQFLDLKQISYISLIELYWPTNLRFLQLNVICTAKKSPRSYCRPDRMTRVSRYFLWISHCWSFYHEIPVRGHLRRTSVKWISIFGSANLPAKLLQFQVLFSLSNCREWALFRQRRSRKMNKMRKARRRPPRLAPTALPTVIGDGSFE